MGSAINRWSNAKLEPGLNPEDARCINVKLPASVTYAAGTILGEVAATPGLYSAYASGNSDGTQNPKGILQYASATDASGNVIGQFGEINPIASMYYTGTFFTSDILQSGAGSIDANAVTKLGLLKQGTTANGILRIG